MAMNTLSTAARNAMCDALVDLLDGGSLEVYTASFATLLGTLTLGSPAFGDAATGTATANAITADSDADDTGTAAVFLVKTSGGTEVYRGTVGLSSADIIVDDVDVKAGDTITVSSYTVTVPAS